MATTIAELQGVVAGLVSVVKDLTTNERPWARTSPRFFSYFESVKK